MAAPVSLTGEDERVLRALASGYASAVDRRDVDGFVDVFAPDGALRVHDPGVYDEPRAVRRGRDELATVIERMTVYDATFHFLGQATYAEDGDGATGEVYCTAHHLTRTRHGANDFTMLIRYRDRYARVNGGWRIAERAVLVDWTALQTAIAPPRPR
jgi:hypothetical protein